MKKQKKLCRESYPYAIPETAQKEDLYLKLASTSPSTPEISKGVIDQIFHKNEENQEEFTQLLHDKLNEMYESAVHFAMKMPESELEKLNIEQEDESTNEHVALSTRAHVAEDTFTSMVNSLLDHSEKASAGADGYYFDLDEYYNDLIQFLPNQGHNIIERKTPAAGAGAVDDLEEGSGRRRLSRKLSTSFIKGDDERKRVKRTVKISMKLSIGNDPTVNENKEHPVIYGTATDACMWRAYKANVLAPQCMEAMKVLETLDIKTQPVGQNIQRTIVYFSAKFSGVSIAIILIAYLLMSEYFDDDDEEEDNEDEFDTEKSGDCPYVAVPVV
jgi:hypothetical protein